jgi:Zn-dependent protease
VNNPPELPKPPEPPALPQHPFSGDGSPTPPPSPWKKFLGPFAGVAAVIAKFLGQIKFLLLPILKFFPLILKTGGSMILSIGAYAMIWGWKWAVGFVVLIFVHECGHLIVARQFGLKVSAPVFIPFMGAFILLKDAPKDAWMEACVGIGGPIYGSIGGLFCHAAGLYFNSPLLVSLGYSAYFLNLFNLTPVGQLDGGRIVTALSPWMWLPGLAIMIWFAIQHMNPIVIIILIMSVPRVISLFRPRTDAEQRYFEVTPERRLKVAAMYFGLIALLLLGMQSTHTDLEDLRHIHQPAISQAASGGQTNGLERL